MRYIVFILLIFLPQIVLGYSLPDAMKAAIQNNSMIKVEKMNTEVAKTQRFIAYNNLLPQISLQGSYNDIRPENSDQTLVNKDVYKQSSVSVTQNLFAGGQSISTIDEVKASIAYANCRLDNVTNDILIKTIKSYVGVETARFIVIISKHNEKTIAQDLNIVIKRQKHGEVTKTDVALAKSHLAQAKAEKIKAENDLKAIEAQFLHIIGHKAPDKLETVNIDNKNMPSNINHFIRIIFQNNPEYLQSKHNVNIKNAVLNQAKGRILPTINATANFIRTDRNSLSRNDTNQYMINFSLPINLSQYGNYRKELFSRKASKNQLAEAAAVLREQAYTLWHEYISSNAVVSATNAAMHAAKEAYNGTASEAKIGSRTTFDLLEAKRGYLKRRVENRRAIANKIVAFYRLYQLMGKIPL